jgi:hypothetical protein
MAVMGSKMLAEIESRMLAGRAIMADVERSVHISGNLPDIEVLDVKRGVCNHWTNGYLGPHCGLIRRIPNQKIKICSDCPIWKTTDAIYEDVYSTHVLETYSWWRDEYERTGQIYAKDRMVDFVEAERDRMILPTPAPTVRTSARNIPLQLFCLGLIVGIILGTVVQTITLLAF